MRMIDEKPKSYLDFIIIYWAGISLKIKTVYFLNKIAIFNY